MDKVSPPDGVPAGRRFAHFEIVEKLGAGGMGEVYVARDLTLGRDVAVKYLAPGAASDPTRLARFQQEARAASTLNHPNIVTIHQVGEEQGQHFIVMELVKGRTLRSMLEGQPFRTRDLVDLAAQLAEGLAKAHESGIVHRDLKPENVMVTDDGLVKILDFGLAKLLAPVVPAPDADADTQSIASPPGGTAASPTPATAPGVVMGTVGYMAPEQAKGHVADERSDQFALGAILYEMATGRRAFLGPTAVQTMAAIIEKDPESIGAINGDCPATLRWIIERCLAKPPEKRYASTADLARDLRTLRERLDEVTPSAAIEAGAPEGRARIRRLALGAAVMVAVVAAGLLVRHREALVDWLQIRPLPARKQVAILPFDTGGQAAERVFAEGLADTLGSQLARLERFQGSLWIVPASETRAADVRSAADARRRFGATLALAGRLSGAPERVHLDVSLIDAGTSRLLRSFAIDTPAKEIGTLQDGLASRVLAALALETPEAARETLVAGKTASSGAYDLYVRGRGFLGRYEKVESLEAAITHFQQAIQQDPQYALAYAGLGEAYWRHYQLTKRDDSVELAKKTCAKALELNELLAPVHVTLGIVHRGTGHAGDAVGNFERALALDPANADARRELAGAYEDLGKLEEAEAEYRKAVEMRPEDWAGHNRLGAFLFRHGHYADAEREFRKVVSLVPDNVRGHVNLAAVLQLSGQESEALVELERSAAIRPTAAALTNLATLQFYRSEYRAAARTLERARALDSTDFRIWYGLAAAYYWAPGEGAKAGDAYRKAVERGESQRRVNPNDAELLAQLASCYAMIGQKSRARAFVSRALQLAPRNANVAFFAATVLEDLDQREAALSHLGRAIELGFSMSDIEREPTLVRLRTDPRYDLLRKRMKPATQ